MLKEINDLQDTVADCLEAYADDLPIRVHGALKGASDALFVALEDGEAARTVTGMMTYAEVTAIYRDKLAATGSMDAALMKVAWVAFNRGLAAAKS